MKKLLFLALLLLSIQSLFSQTKNNLIDYVDPFIGTGGHGHTFPGATVPFGMMQLSPDTRLTGWDGCSAYHYTDNIVYGFSHTHLSGTGISDYADVLLMPYTGVTHFNNGADGNKGYRSLFKKENEFAKPAYYETFLEGDQIEVKLTASERCGYHQYIFPEGSDQNIMIDLEHRDLVLDAALELDNAFQLSGYRHSKEWADDQRLFFVIRFNKEINKIRYQVKEGTAKIKAAVSFGESNTPLEVKVAISSVDVEGAKKNLEAEIAELSFEEVLNSSQKKWEKELSKIEIETDESITQNKNNKIVFYSALYHTMIAPNLFMDVDGRYLGTDLKVHQTNTYDHYTIFSLWDTYRAAHPLYTIIDEKRSNDFINTFLNQYKQGGYLPMWELAANYTGCMIGYHSVPVIADAFIKGINQFDERLALKAMVDIASANRLGIPSYIESGFLSGEEEAECVSKTLEYAYDDWTIAEMASEMGAKQTADQFYQRAQNYKNVFDSQTGFMRARLNNQWFAPFDPSEVNFNYTEANSWQYSFYVPQDIDGWMKLLGGEDALDKKLDALFGASSITTGRDQADITGLIGQYAHGNEPSHHIAYLYNYVGKPYKTQKYVRQIMTELYNNDPDGYSGNEDCGQMSAWLVLSALGFYPVAPGSEDYILGSPLFEKATINLENGRKFKIIAENNDPQNKYIQSVSKNGSQYSKSYIKHQDIKNGATYHFKMGSKPNYDFGYTLTDRPVSKIYTDEIVAVPAVYKGEKAFKINTTIGINCATPEAEIFYQIDNGPTLKYKGEFTIYDKCEITTWAKRNGIKSKKAQSNFYLMYENRSISLETEYANQYAAGGNNALIDQIKGGKDFRVGNWQGYEKVDLVATVDLGSTQNINNINVGFLQDENSWIFMPLEVQFYISRDGIKFKEVGNIVNTISPKEKGSIIRNFEIDLTEQAKYVKVIAKNRAYCPEYHKGAGGKCWVFVDEISVE